MFVAVFLVNSSANAANIWDSGGGDYNITTPENWQGDSPPDFASGTQTLTFGTGGDLVILDTPVNATGLVLNRNSNFSLVSISNANIFTLGSAGVSATPDSAATVTYTFTNPVALSANQTWTVQSLSPQTTTVLVAGLQGDFNLTKNGTGLLSISQNGTRNNSNSATVNQGILELQTAAALNTNANAQLLLNGGQLRLANNLDTTFTGTNITVSANSSITTTRATASTGNVPVHTIGDISIGAHTLTMGEGGIFANTGLGVIQSGAVTLTGNAVFNVVNNSNADALFKLGAIGESVANRTLTKTGNGTLEFTATNSFTGNTTVAAGTLLANSDSSSSAVNVLGNATIGGNGTVGALTLANNATLSPGNSPGNLSVQGNAVWNGGSNYNWQVAALNNGTTQISKGVNWDFFSVNGTLNLSGLDTTPLNFNLWTLSSLSPETNGILPGWASASGNNTWAIAEATGGILLNSTPLLANTTYTSLFNINTTAMNGAGGWFGSLPTAGFEIITLADVNTLYLFASAPPATVPEPGQIAASLLLLGGLAAHLLLKRRRLLKSLPAPARQS